MFDHFHAIHTMPYLCTTHYVLPLHYTLCPTFALHTMPYLCTTHFVLPLHYTLCPTFLNFCIMLDKHFPGLFSCQYNVSEWEEVRLFTIMHVWVVFIHLLALFYICCRLVNLEQDCDCENGELVLHGNIDQTLVNSLHGLLNFEIGGLDCHVITTEYRTRVHCIHSDM